MINGINAMMNLQQANTQPNVLLQVDIVDGVIVVLVLLKDRCVDCATSLDTPDQFQECSLCQRLLQFA